jgi:hypothetical protein
VKHLHVWWWMLLPCAYFLFCVFVMKLMRWASEHENFEPIEFDEYEWTELSPSIDAGNDAKGTSHRVRGSYMEDVQ